MYRTRNNVAIEEALKAVARAHVQMPGFNAAKARELINTFSAACAGARAMEVTVAAAAILASSLDEPGASPQSWLPQH